MSGQLEHIVGAALVAGATVVAAFLVGAYLVWVITGRES